MDNKLSSNKSSSIGAANIYNYLKAAKQKNLAFTEIKRDLELFVVSILNFSDDSWLIQILSNFGWNVVTSKFTGEVDMDGLRIALSKKSLQLSSRASQLGPTTNSKSFVPEMLMHYLCYVLKQPTPTLKPASFSFPGVCLLCDISGFTRLSGDYCLLGKNGIDGLQKATNGYMGRLVDVIYGYGGDIIKFAGDAIICVFLNKKLKEKVASSGGSNLSLDEIVNNEEMKDGSARTVAKPPLYENCIDAMNCAMDLREISTDLLTVHVAVSCGDMCFGVLGGVQDKWECLISGDCLAQLSQCLDDAPSRNVAITEQVAKIIGEEKLVEFSCQRMDSSNYLVRQKPEIKIETKVEEEESPTNAISTILCNQPVFMDYVDKFVPWPVILGFKGGELNLLAEIREVTTMFIKFDSYSSEKHKDLTNLQPHFNTAQGILMDLGGFIRQFLVDDKGCVLIACWGVPTSSFLDNSTRALRAAVLIKQELNKLDMEVSTGITTGNVYCGNVGSEVRREYAAIGDVVNLAARLMSKAKHGIFMDEATFSRVSFEVNKLCRALPPMQVKGKPYPINAFSYESPVAPKLNEAVVEEYDIRQLCKVELLKILEEMVSPVTKGLLSFSISFKDSVALSKIILLEGKVGTGKGTAAKWFRKEAQERELRVITISADPKDCVIEYKILSKLFREFIGEDVTENANQLKLMIMHVLKAIYAEDRNTIDKIALPAVRVAFGLGHMMGNANPGHNLNPATTVRNPVTTGKLPPWMINETIRDVFTFLLNEQPTVIIIENIQFCDEASLKALLVIQEIKCKFIMMLTMLNAEDYAEFNALKNSTSVFSGAGLSMTSSSMQTEQASMEWLETFRHILVQNPNTSFIKMGDLNISEVDAMIRTALKVDNIPLGLAEYVQQLSGGSMFWINTVIDFLKTTSPEEFMKMTTDPNFTQRRYRGEATPRVGETTKSANGNTNSTFTKSSNPNRGHLFSSFSISNINAGGSSPTTMIKELSQTVSEQHSSNMKSGSFQVNTQKSKLDLFIVYRFEKLPLDYQRILKAASVIGFEFSRYILYGILSNQLKATMYAALKSLVKEHWISKPEEGDSDYVFNHPLIYDILYDLTPSSDRTALHKSIAEYYESVNSDDPKYFGEMSRHFAYCNTAKAFEYAMKKADFILEPEELDLELSLMILNDCLKFVTTVAEVQTVQKVLEKAKMIFHGTDNSDTESLAGPESSRTFKSAMSSKANLGIFCCMSRKLIANNVVAPEMESSMSRSARRANDRENSISMSARSSYRNGMAYTEKGKGLIARLLHRIERKLNQLLKTYTDQGKFGRSLPWQIQMSGDDVELDDDDDKSAASKMSWTYRVPNKMKR